MLRPSNLEEAVLYAIAAQNPDRAEALRAQILVALVAHRKNTGAGFYTTFELEPQSQVVEGCSPLGKVVAADIAGLEHGMGFLLWLRDGRLHQLEGFSFGENTSGLDLASPVFSIREPSQPTE